jgi:hypothetical protein
MEEKNMPKADFVTGIGLFLFGLAVLIRSLQMPRFASLGVNPYSVPGITPGLLGAVLTILGGMLLFRSVRRKGYRLGLNRGTLRAYFVDASTRRFLVALFLSVIYGAFALRRIPYAVATGLYVLAFVLIFEYRSREPFSSRKRTLFFSFMEALLVSVGVTLVFRYLFLVDLP